jgi:hypothetical protein
MPQARAPGVYIHCLKRKLGAFILPTYYNTLSDFQIVNCDIGVEFSSDANANVLRDFFIHQWKEAAILMNGSYGNRTYGMKLESPLDVSPDFRYAIELGTHNYGTETDTDPNYSIDGPFNNVFDGYAELPNNTNNKVALFRQTVPTTGTTYGRNTLDVTGILVSGIGVDGRSIDSSIGRNEVRVQNIYKDRKHEANVDIFGLEMNELDDESGYSYGTNESRVYSGREAAAPEGQSIGILEIDNVGTTTASLTIKLSFCGKGIKQVTNHGGEMSWVCGVESGTAKPAVKYKDFQDSDGETPPATFTVAEASNPGENSGRYTLTMNTATLGLGELSYYSWKVELVHSNLEGTNLDWNRDVRYLT